MVVIVYLRVITSLLWRIQNCRLSPLFNFYSVITLPVVLEVCCYLYSKYLVRCEIVASVTVENTGFCHVTPCGVVEICSLGGSSGFAEAMLA